MLRKTLVAATLLACVPAFVSGQDSRTATLSAPCCGQTVDSAAFASAAEARQYTQITIQSILLRRTNSLRLSAGDYVVSTSPDGFKFKATVNSSRVVSGWYLTNPIGQTVLRTSSQGPVDPDKVDACVARFANETYFIVDAYEKGGISKYTYGQQISAVWQRFWMCLNEADDVIQ
jgi:hypothetical protein